MRKKNVLSGFTKIDKEQLVGQTLTIKDLIKVTTENGPAVAAIFDDNTFTYVPSADLDYVLDYVLTDEDALAEIHAGYQITITEHTSKSQRKYYTMFE